LHDDPHGGTRLGRARDGATQQPGSVRQVYVVRSGGVPEATADVDGARQFKWSHVLVEEIQHEIRGSRCVMKTYSSADSRERRRPCIGCPESAARDSCPRSRQSTRSAHRVLGNLTQASSSAQPCAIVLKENDNAVLPAPAQIAQTQSSCATPTVNAQC